jgi:hypothetical protein
LNLGSLVTIMSSPIIVPSRFESLIDNAKLKAQPTLIKVDADLKSIAYLGNKVRTQSGGVLAFVLGSTGAGKSTAAFAASIYLGDMFKPLIRVPSTIELRDVNTWLNSNLPAKDEKLLPVLFDGREVTDDQVGLRQFLANLNQLLRNRGDIGRRRIANGIQRLKKPQKQLEVPILFQLTATSQSLVQSVLNGKRFWSGSLYSWILHWPKLD